MGQLLLNGEEAGTPRKRRQKQAEALYNAYPKKVGKRAAVAAAERALERDTFENILAKVEEFCSAKMPLKGTMDWKYVCHPSTWFNQDRWRDEGDKPKAPNPYLD